MFRDTQIAMAGFFSRFKDSLIGRKTSNSKAQRYIQEPDAASIDVVGEFFTRYLFGDQNDSSPLTVPQKLVLAATEKNLERKDTRLKAIPRLPKVIPKLMRSLRDDESSARDYVEIINKDPAVSGAILKQANSAYFNPGNHHIQSIEAAVVKLGIDGLKTVLSTVVMQPLIEKSSHYHNGFGRKLWQHTLHCAASCEIIAINRGMDPYKAYLLGLVHDIGKITIFSELNHQFAFYQNDDNNPGPEAFAPLMYKHSAELSQRIAVDWELPPELVEALKQQINISDGQSVSAYGELLFQANLASELYFSAQYANEERELLLDQAKEALQEMKLPSNLFTRLDMIDLAV